MWSPYKNEKTVAAVFEEFANQEKLTTEWLTLDAAKEDFVVQAQSALDRAAGRSIRSVLVVDPLSLADANQRAALAKLRDSFRVAPVFWSRRTRVIATPSA